jgi:hypothetical protein
MELKTIMLSEISYTQDEKCSHMWNLDFKSGAVGQRLRGSIV